MRMMVLRISCDHVKKCDNFAISLPGLGILSCIEPLVIINWYYGSDSVLILLIVMRVPL